MRFLFVRPEFCPLGDLSTPKIRLSSDSTSRWTPLPLASPSRYRADSGLSPYRTCAHRAHIENCRRGQLPLRQFSCQAEHIPKPKEFVPVCFGGGGESRTPVRKQLDWNFSGRSPLFTFPHPDGNGHPAGFGSFMMHGAGKAYRTHGLHSNHTRARLVDLPGRMGA